MEHHRNRINSLEEMRPVSKLRLAFAMQLQNVSSENYK